MSDKKDTTKALLPSTREGGHLSDFSHRAGSPPSVSEVEGLITEATPAQRERLIYLIDDALDTLEDGMAPGNKVADRISSANSVLDRAGVSSKSALSGRSGETSISAEALTQVIGGLAQMFGTKTPKGQRDVSQTPSSVSKQAIESEHGHSLKPEPEQKEEEEKSKKDNSGGSLPKSLLRSYGAQVEE